MMTDLVEGRDRAGAAELEAVFRGMLHGDPEAAKDPDLDDSRLFAGVGRFPARLRCAKLPWTALERVLGL